MDVLHSGLEGLHRAETSIEQAASRIALVPLFVSDGMHDTVDLSAEAVALLLAKNSYEANLKLIEAGAELENAVLDILG
ncbi:MAG: hypothetical protein HY235_21580 [Acidobacteria bacterium]|nr:hypothetical protein [Acidobacteriota bacterium]